MRIFLAWILIFSICACVNDNGQESPAPDSIRLGVLPDQSESSLQSRFAPLVAFLEAETGLEIELWIPRSYEEMLNEFDAGELHLASFGGVTFVQAEQRSQAEPLVMRDVDLQFVSCYLARVSDGRRSVADFAGEPFAFGPKLSTSGHIMPRHFLTISNIEPEKFFASVRYTSGHDDTVNAVTNGTVVIGVANCDILQSMLADARLEPNTLRILDTTPPYANYVWAVQPSLHAKTKNLIRDAFLALDPSNPQHQSILRLQGAGGYFPAGYEDLNDVREAIRAVGLLDPSAAD